MRIQWELARKFNQSEEMALQRVFEQISLLATDVHILKEGMDDLWQEQQIQRGILERIDERSQRANGDRDAALAIKEANEQYLLSRSTATIGGMRLPRDERHDLLQRLAQPESDLPPVW